METFTSPVIRIDSPVWTSIAPVPQPIAENLIEKTTDKRVICTLNDKLKKHCALMPRGDGSYYILINKQELKQLGISLNEEIHISLAPDHSDYGMPLDDEFRAVLDSDPEGEKYFEALTPGKKRTLLYMVHKIKDGQKKILKSIIIVDHLKMTGGKIDYKLLQQQFKERKS
ncbi:YdeI/OmpD-associated family protein [Sinomicrobium weinanense]|uniref:DUF1905 domain-containing protein n=1 Tax=Sinomicrobium weinanense TaxID=2842200 RepID=A0A926PZQ5_9FLAO|nr:YdeI/OmpD-associated family protein [Sinomicrobium weinanense]MBC9794362.1 DUF1905 domain-containing protein [Sinomicrobium weinanense]MBU3124269.1 YdeI/OmpD-associated family protein [Sinomicrobium weinanense]